MPPQRNWPGAACSSAGISPGWICRCTQPPQRKSFFCRICIWALAAKGDIVVFRTLRALPACVPDGPVQSGGSGAKARWPGATYCRTAGLVDAATPLSPTPWAQLTPRGKYLVLLSEAPVAKLADSFGAPFVSALGDICETAALTPESLSAVAKAEFDKLAARAQKALGFTRHSRGCGTAPCRRKQRTRQGRAGRAGILGPRLPLRWPSTRLEHDDAPKAAALGAADGRLTADFGAGRRICSPCFLKLTKARWKL